MIRDTLPWTEKYRPQNIADIVSHRYILQSLQQFIAQKTLPHLLFFGPSGSGKTTTIKCCIEAIYHQYAHCMTLQLNASNERGIETVRTKIKNFVASQNSIFLPPSARCIYKLVILDEIDSMTVEAQGMLRQTIEKNSHTTRFCLICNDIDKINLALQSRCALYRFAPVTAQAMHRRLINICQTENIVCQPTAIDAIIKITKGDMRAAINVLQCVHSIVNTNISATDVYQSAGYCSPHTIEIIYQWLLDFSQSKTSLLKVIETINDAIIEHNITLFHLLEELKNKVMSSTFNSSIKIKLIDQFAQIEVYDSVNVDTKILVGIIASLFGLIYT